MKIALIFGKKRPDTMGIYFERALKALGHDIVHFSPEDINNIKPEYDFYFRVDDGHYDYLIPERLRPRVYYVSDTHLKGPFKKIKKHISQGAYDLVFCPMLKEIKVLKKISPVDVIWMNVGCDPEIHKRLDVERKYDIGFVGNDGGIPRKFYLQEIRERYPNSFIGRTDYREISCVYSASKIGFSFAIRGECFTMRNYEIMSCGAMLLMKRLRDSSAERTGFIDRKHIVLFDGPEDLFELIEYYLRNKKEREEIAENGYRLTVGKHTYTQRLSEMLGIIKDRFKV
ncbi:MAG: glycosyltransferase [Candidatus Omnitrophica bacterium]|nr:glycosyltransferase [Candidatus Omnitrophota bacterium]